MSSATYIWFQRELGQCHGQSVCGIDQLLSVASNKASVARQGGYVVGTQPRRSTEVTGGILESATVDNILAIAWNIAVI